MEIQFTKKGLNARSLILNELLVGETFTFVDYEEETPFLVIDQKGYCMPTKMHHNPRTFVLNLKTNAISHRTLDARVERVSCTVSVTRFNKSF